MKLKAAFLFTLVSISTVLANPTYSQVAKISLDMENRSLEKVMDEIEKQSEFYFVFNQKQIDVSRIVSVHGRDRLITDILPGLFDGTGINYLILDRKILLDIKPIEDKIQPYLEGSGNMQQKITGKVTDKSGAPLPGVSVVVKGTVTGITTDSNGSFSLVLPPNAEILSFSFVGMNTMDVEIGNQTVFNIILEETSLSLDEVVVIGYGTQKKIEVTSAVSSVKSVNFVQGTVKDAGQLLQGKVAGLNIGTPSGDPNTSAEIMLRGTGTLNSSISPLILIDGIPGGMNTVAPEDIESIDVLKDASAAAIYGTRGSNGVILITTKKSTGVIAPEISYSAYLSTQSFVKVPEMLTAAEYRAHLSDVPGFHDYGSSTNWIKEISRVPVSYNHNLSFRGGNKKTNYIVTLGYRKIQGVIITTENRLINSRIDVTHNMFDDKIKLNFNVIHNDLKKSATFNPVAFRDAERYNPTSPVYNSDGTYFENFGPTENYNPVEMIRETFGGGQSLSDVISGNLIWNPLKGLNFKMVASRDKSNSLNSIGNTKKHYTTTLSGMNGYASKSSGQSIDHLLELTAEFSRIINSHNFSVLVGYSYQNFESENYGMTNYDFPAGNYSYIDNIGLGNALKIGNGTEYSSKYVSNLIGFFGRANYNFDEKYLLMATLRYEAASQFLGTKKPWGTFPSVSAGWRISEEDFMKGLSFLDNLKLRAGYGETGTSPDALFLGVSRLGYSGSFLIDGKWVPSLVPISNPNPDLKWEERHETNIGLDFSVLKGRISGSVDYYMRKTVGLLFDYQVPSPPNLYTTTKANVGVMENKGIEALITLVPVKMHRFSWISNFTFSKNKNQLVSLYNDLYSSTNPYFDDGRSPTPIGDITHRIAVSQPIGNFWGYKVIDITNDGHWVYEDPNGNPTTATPDPATFRKVIGNGIPKFNAGWNNTLTYGHLDLSANMRGAFGFQIMNAYRMVQELPGFSYYNLLSSAFNKIYGKAVLANDVSPENNSYYVEQGDYWKIDNVALGYKFNFKNEHIKDTRVYFSVQNALTLTRYKGMDPEVTIFGTTGSSRLTPGYDDRDRYPSTRVFTIGLSVTFN